MKVRAMSLLAVAAVLAAGTLRAEPQRRTERVTQGDVSIVTFVEGSGPAVVMLPSSGRDGAEDFDAVAARIAAPATPCCVRSRGGPLARRARWRARACISWPGTWRW